MTATTEAPPVPSDSPAPPEAPPDRPGPLHEALWVAGVSTVSVGIALVLYQVWRANLHLPLGVSYDMRLTTAGVKGLGQRGWWDKNPLLGAPFGQDMRDFPSSGETSQRLVIRALGSVVHSPGLTINIYFFAGFAMIAAVGFLVFRRFGLSAPVAAGLAIAYDFLAFHYLHGPDHITRSAYFTAPLTVLLLVRVLEPESRFLRDPSARVRRPYFGANGSVQLRNLVPLVAIGIVIGCTETINTVFTVVMLVLVGIIGALAAKRVSRLVFALILAGSVAGTFVFVSIPILLHQLSAGANPVAGHRFVFESDMYGLRIGFMMLPTRANWISALGKHADALWNNNPFPSEGGQAIGIIGVIGVLAAAGMLFVRALRDGARDDPRDDRRRRRFTPRAAALAMPFATIVLVAILLGAGGATVIDSVSGFLQVRTWDRIVVIVAFAAFALTGIGCERILHRLQGRAKTGRTRVLVGAGMVVVLGGLGVFDGGRPPLPEEAKVTATWVSDQNFVAGMHTVQPENGMIFEFPVVRFPESAPVWHMQDYDQFRGYLADKGSFRWSYGAVKGRPDADWQAKLRAIPTDADLRALLGLGFTGLWVNRDGYNDRGRFFESRLVPLLGAPTLVSRNQRLSFYDLRPFAAKIKPGTDLAAEARSRFGVSPPAGT